VPRPLILVAQRTMSLYRVDPGWALAMSRHCTKVWSVRSDLTESRGVYPLLTNQLRLVSGQGEFQL
jgi:hypothetical protein